jgi:hypothetical protein
MRLIGGLGTAALFALIAACGGSDSTPSGHVVTDKAPTVPATLLANGIKVKDVAVFQGVKVPIVQDADVYGGKVTSPVVANRPGIVRVYVTPDAGFTPQKITAELHLVGPDGKDYPKVTDSKHISAESKEEDEDSTFNLEFPADSFPPGVLIQVWLTADGGTATPDATQSTSRYPADGTLWQDVGAISSGKIRVTLVPMIYTADGSNRAPTTTADQLDLYKKTLMKRYPTSDVELTMHDPVKYDQAIDGMDGDSFSAALTFLSNLRASDDVGKDLKHKQHNVDDDIYYFGLFSPADSFETYCAQGCIAGLSTVATEYKASSLRTSVGIGFPGKDAADTFAHELGHAHGRQHAPCGNPASPDPKFPYKEASIGDWGYDIFEKQFLSPTKYHDMMSYCDNNWLSDYTYNALYNRISKLETWMQTKTTDSDDAAAAAEVLHPETSQHWVMGTVDSHGNVKLDTTGLNDIHTILTEGEQKKASFVNESGIELDSKTAHFFPYDHAKGGVVFVPKTDHQSWKQLRLDGFAPLSR